MYPLNGGDRGLRAALAFLPCDDADFVADGLHGLPLDRALDVLNGLRPMYGWTDDENLTIVERLLDQVDVGRRLH